MQPANTLLLKLEGYLQSWGERGRWTVRDTAALPTKSGVIGLLCAALGDANAAVELSAALKMAVRIEKPGQVLRDFQTVTTGTLAAGGGVRGGNDPATFLSNRYYLSDASFSVCLMGDPTLIEKLRQALLSPVWPLYLGRMCCIPSAPILQGARFFKTLEEAVGEGDVEIECEPISDAVVRMDTIKSVAYRSFSPRYVRRNFT